MIRKIKAIAAAAAVAGTIALTGATSASALNVGTLTAPVGTGTMSSTASGGASRVVINGSIAFNCATTSFVASTGTGLYPTLPATIGTLQFQFSSCIGPGGLAFDRVCTSFTSFEILTFPVGPAWGGRYSNISCTVSITGIGCAATLSGSVPVQYTNPTPSTAAVATIPVSGQALTVTGSTCPGVLPNGTAQWGAPTASPLGLANLPLTIGGAPTSQPLLT